MQEQCFKGEVLTFTVQGLILYHHPVDLLIKTVWNFTYKGAIQTCWRHLSKLFCLGAEHLKVEARSSERNENTFTLKVQLLQSNL